VAGNWLKTPKKTTKAGRAAAGHFALFSVILTLTWDNSRNRISQSPLIAEIAAVNIRTIAGKQTGEDK